LLMAFRGIQSETVQKGGVHNSIARNLHLVADPFKSWELRPRLKTSKSPYSPHSLC
jgi:hypothetical protein